VTRAAASRDARLVPGEFVEYTRGAIDRMHVPGAIDQPHEGLWGVVVSVSDHPHGGLVVWRHQRGEAKTFGCYLCRCGSDFRERACDGD